MPLVAVPQLCRLTVLDTFRRYCLEADASIAFKYHRPVEAVARPAVVPNIGAMIENDMKHAASVGAHLQPCCCFSRLVLSCLFCFPCGQRGCAPAWPRHSGLRAGPGHLSLDWQLALAAVRLCTRSCPLGCLRCLLGGTRRIMHVRQATLRFLALAPPIGTWQGHSWPHTVCPFVRSAAPFCSVARLGHSSSCAAHCNRAPLLPTDPLVVRCRLRSARAPLWPAAGPLPALRR